MQMKTKVEIINETVAFYSEDVKRRAVNEDGICEYKTKDGRKCAVGRVLLAKAFRADIEGCNALEILERYGDDILKKKYRGHEPQFWNKLQRIHDWEGHWNDDGLTHLGVDCKDSLIQKVITNAK